MTPTRITLYRDTQAGAWMAQTTDPRTRELFGTDTIPTAFTLRADPARVLQAITALNPDATVTVRS